MAMELCASLPISHLPVFSPVLSGTPHLRPKHALPLRRTLPSHSARALHSRYRHFAISLPRAAAADDSNGFSPLITEERDVVTVLEDSPSASSVVVEDSPAEKLSSDEIATSEVPIEESVVDAPVVTVEDSSSAEKVADNDVATFEEPKEESVEGGQEQAFEVLKDFQLESVDTYSLALYGGGAFFGLWLVSAIVGAVDSIPLVPKLLEVVGLGYTVWFTARFLLFKESREELAAKIDEVKEQVIGSD